MNIEKTGQVPRALAANASGTATTGARAPLSEADSTRILGMKCIIEDALRDARREQKTIGFLTPETRGSAAWKAQVSAGLTIAAMLTATGTAVSGAMGLVSPLTVLLSVPQTLFFAGSTVCLGAAAAMFGAVAAGQVMWPRNWGEAKARRRVLAEKIDQLGSRRRQLIEHVSLETASALTPGSETSP